MKKNITLFLLLFVCTTLCGIAPRRGITWQWCFEKPQWEFQRATLDAMKAVGYDTIMPEYGALLDHDEFRRLLRHARRSGLAVIPLVNSLGHAERTIRWEKPLGDGMDLGEESNYEQLFAVLNALIEDFRAEEMPLEYLHLGMDEASECLLANSRKYGKPTTVLLKDHILRLREFCLKNGIRMVIWHDMLMSSEDPLFDGDMNYMHSDAAGAWKIRQELPRDLILDYWIYEAKERYAVAEGLQKEGFEVWLTPWGLESVESMRKLPAFQTIIASTWMESGYFPTALPPDNSLVCNRWLLDALARLVDREPLDFAAAYFPPPSSVTAAPPLDSPVELGQLPPKALPTANLKMPLQLLFADGTRRKLDRIDQPRGENQSVLYTPAYGATTQCNGFGVELTLVDNQLREKTTWGVGNSAIPPGGCVLSAHGSAMAGLEAQELKSTVQLLDADGNAVSLYASPQLLPASHIFTPDSAAARAVHFRWHTRQSAALDGKPLATVTLTFVNGQRLEREILYGRDITDGGEVLFLWGETAEVQRWYQPDEALLNWQWAWPEQPVALKEATVTLTQAGIACGMKILAAEFPTEEPAICALDLQWCYRPVEPGVMRKTLRTMQALGFNTIVPEFGPMVRWTAPEESPLPLDEVRAFLRDCAAKNLQVIPKINSFGHADRGFPWPVKAGEGLDLGAEANYAALAAEVRAWQREMAAAGLHLKYFHFGMDEASDALAANLRRYPERNVAELVAGHMNQVATLCRELGISGIIYHDMLIGGKEEIFWRDMGTGHADATDSYLARPLVDRSLLINYWNYEGFDRYRTIEALRKEGFRILFTPWGGSSVRKMARNAALYGEGLLGSTWCDFNLPAPTEALGGNTLYNQAWIRDALQEVAFYRHNPAATDQPRPPDGGLAWIERWHNREATHPVSTQPDLPGVICKIQDIDFRMVENGSLGIQCAADIAIRQEARFRQALWPLSVWIDGRQVAQISSYNRPANAIGLTLYSQSYGAESGVDIYSTEARIQNDQIWSKNDWGVGHTLIPLNGYVISGWGEAHYGLPALPVGAAVELRDARGEKISGALPPEALQPAPTEFILPIAPEIHTLHLLHSTALEGDLSLNAVAVATVRFADGTTQSRTFHYGRELAAAGEAMLAATADPAVWHAVDGLYAYTWVLPGDVPATELRISLAGDGVRLGYRLHGVAWE